MDTDSFELSSTHSIQAYPIGLIAGERLKLLKRIISEDQEGHPIGIVHEKGEIWTVHPGCIDDLEIIWLQQPDGKVHTWDFSIFDTFERLKAGQKKTEPNAAANP